MSVALACFIVLLILKHILNGETALSVVYKYVSFGALHSTCKHDLSLLKHELLPPPCHCDVLPRRLVFCQLFSVLTFFKFVDFQTSSERVFSAVQVDAQACTKVRFSLKLRTFQQGFSWFIYPLLMPITLTKTLSNINSQFSILDTELL